MSGERIYYPRESWVWQGTSAHFICGPWCRFHLATVVGPWMVSTVGEYVSVMDTRRHGESAQPTQVGAGRMYETMVFRIGGPCTNEDCNCGEQRIANGESLDFAAANTGAEAHATHREMCEKWSRREIGYGADPT